MIIMTLNFSKRLEPLVGRLQGAGNGPSVTVCDDCSARGHSHSLFTL